MELWNKRDLAPPVLNTFPCKTKNRQNEIRSFIATITDATGYFQSLQPFEKAAAYVSRFSIRWSNRFYNMHGFRLLKRLNQALLRFRSVDIGRMLANLVSLLPDGNYLEKTAPLPTRANLEYLLIRLQGLAKLLCHIVILAKDAAKYYVRFMSTGYFFNLCSIFLCLLAEVWYKSREICCRVVQIYNQLVPFRSLLEDAGEGWSAGAGCSLPEDLGTWLGEDYTQEVIFSGESSEVYNVQSGTDLFHLLTAEDEDLSTAKKVDAKIDKKVEQKAGGEAEPIVSIPKTLLMQRIKSDEGETVDRKSTAPPNKISKNQIDTSRIDKIRSKFDVKKFIDDEKALRKTNRKKALSEKVADPVFNVFASGMMRDFHKMSSGDYVKVFKEEWETITGMKSKENKKEKRKPFRK